MAFEVHYDGKHNIGAKRFWAKVNKTETCWEWTGKLNRNGYGRIAVADPKLGVKPCGKTRQREFMAHRISFEWANGFDSVDGFNVCHSCDNPRCVRPDHLFIGTQVDNLSDMTKKGRRAMGDKVANKGEKNEFFNKKHSEENKTKMRSPRKRISI